MSNKPQPVMGTVRQFWVHKEDLYTYESDPELDETFIHTIEAAPTLQLLDKLELNLQKINKNICNPTSMTDARFQLGVTERAIDEALTELRKWKDDLK